LALEPPTRPALEFAAQVAAAYAQLIASRHASPGAGLGGRLFYAGDLDETGRTLVVAANIAGAATLAATADRTAQKKALRDGVVDFPVNSLDEALRILKNQLRKREAVAVCVALEPAAMELEMNERGVAPDLHRSGVSMAPDQQPFTFQADGQPQPGLETTPSLVTWRVHSGSPQELARLDEIALACLDAGDWAAHRWLRLSPRFLGRMAQGLRLLTASPAFASRFAGQVKQGIARGELAPSIEIRSYVRGTEQHLGSQASEEV
jgi:hypothetical protein